MFNKFLISLPWRRERLIETIARQVADLCVDRVCKLVADGIEAMSLCEARGYIRARATTEVALSSRNALAALPQIPTDWYGAIATRAAERVAPMALRRLAAVKRTAHLQLVSTPSQVRPTSAAPARRAA